ncbi:hypothetical protein BX600DRAFT_475993 [Xylariales sp. PMI_506]|nr:hypothetical protein BX600DRAFT_475993 [Xylariales sp. PMI_506]
MATLSWDPWSFFLLRFLPRSDCRFAGEWPCNHGPLLISQGDLAYLAFRRSNSTFMARSVSVLPVRLLCLNCVH